MECYHTSILKEECLSFIQQCKVRKLVDCNLGEGGHTRFFLEKLPDLSVIGVDCDSNILERACENLKGFQDRVRILNFWADEFLLQMQKETADCIFFDLGISMYHYKAGKRGFSFHDDESLDMRLSESDKTSAYDIVNYFDEKKLADVIYANSEERKSRRISSAIVQARKKEKIKSSARLAEIIRSAFSPHEVAISKIDVATKTFQALRIEVNDELSRLKRELDLALQKVSKGGLIMVISFHSIEDRIVKYRFREAVRNGGFELLCKKPICPGESEISSNPASRSAKLRVIRRIS